MRRVFLPLLVALLALPGAGCGATARARVAIFYYPWYGTPSSDGAWLHWGQNGHRPPRDVASAFYPARGAYSSASSAVVHAQMREIAATGVGEVVVSWWGRGSPEDGRLGLVLREAHDAGLEVAAHLEPYTGRAIESVRSDLAYFKRRGIRDVFVYQPATILDADWLRLERPKGMRLFAQTAFVRRFAADGFDGVYTYDLLHFSRFDNLCRVARSSDVLCAPSVGPGFDSFRATGATPSRPRRNGATYDALWRAAIRAKPDLVTITSYNEWHEGTQIEPAKPMTAPDGYRYQTYDGAYGSSGRAAERAYVRRTAYWVGRFSP